jgi:hypothetical protein
MATLPEVQHVRNIPGEPPETPRTKAKPRGFPGAQGDLAILCENDPCLEFPGAGFDAIGDIPVGDLWTFQII